MGSVHEKLLRSLPRMVFTDFVSHVLTFQLTPWWSTNNAALVGEDGETPTVNSEGIVEAVDFLNGMYKDGICPEPISSDGYTMFANNQVAMVGAGRWVLNTWQDAGLTNDDFDCVQWPVKRKTVLYMEDLHGVLVLQQSIRILQLSC